MKHASLFSGIGGFDLAAEWMGWQNIFHCENDVFCQQVLKHHFPNTITYGNIKETDFRQHRGKIDILTGGFPCQPFSDAGLKKGTNDTRYLWTEMFRAIREIRPRWVIAENVRGLISWNEGVVFDKVCTDLENEGYKVTPCLLPACGVNAPHQRYRIWFVAYCSDSRLEDMQQAGKNGISKLGTTPNSDSQRSDRRCAARNKQTKKTPFRTNLLFKTERPCLQSIAPNTSSKQGKQFEFKQPQISKQEQRKYRGVHRQDDNREGRPFDVFPTQSPVCCRDDGFSSQLDGITFPKWRQQSIKGFGNAIVPQVAMQLFKTIKRFENGNNNR